MSSTKSIFIRKDIWYKIDMTNVKEIIRSGAKRHIIFNNGYRPDMPDVKSHDPFSYCIKIKNPEDFKEEMRSDFIGILFQDALPPNSPLATSLCGSPSYPNSSGFDSLPVKK